MQHIKQLPGTTTKIKASIEFLFSYCRLISILQGEKVKYKCIIQLRNIACYMMMPFFLFSRKRQNTLSFSKFATKMNRSGLDMMRSICLGSSNNSVGNVEPLYIILSVLGQIYLVTFRAVTDLIKQRTLKTTWTFLFNTFNVILQFA